MWVSRKGNLQFIHLYDIAKARIKKPICRHVGFCHNFNEKVIKFRALEHVPQPPRGGDRDATIFRREAKWIFRLKSQIASRFE